MNKPKVGDEIFVRVENVPYKTIIDPFGVQRFITNTVLDYMFYHDHDGNRINDLDNKKQRMLDLNALSAAYQQGKFSKRDYGEFMMSLGYSVSGFSELWAFQDWTIDNPLWE